MKKKKQSKLSRDMVQVLQHLKAECNGRANAQFSTDICTACYITDKHLRDMVNRLRRWGYPVCSNTSGYWFASSEADLDITISHMLQRREGLNKALRGLNKAKKRIATTMPPAPTAP